MTPSITPTSKTWTLRFKHHRTTVLLHVDPLQRFSSVRAELLKAVQQTHPDGKLNGHAIPDNTDDVLLARPADINDLSMGWEAIGQDNDEDTFVDDSKSKGKGKAGVGAGTKGRPKKDNVVDCPQGVGLRDGGVVAFKFRSGADATVAKDEVEESVTENEEGERLDSETLVGDAEREQWDVVVPTMEESYGEQEALAISADGQ